MVSATYVLQARALKQTPSWEAAFIRAFVREHGDRYVGFDVNVRVGPGAAAPAGLSPEYAYAASQVTRKRIDLIGWLDAGVDLFEVKRAPDGETVAQILEYARLWKEEHPDVPVHELALLTPPFRPSLWSHLLREQVTAYVYDLITTIDPSEVPDTIG